MDKIKVGVLTVSDRCNAGETEDISGSNLKAILLSAAEKFPCKIVVQSVVPDDKNLIEASLKTWADELELNLILTTGGTGFAPRDVTPEATKSVIHRETPGISMAMMKSSLDITPLAMLSRSVSGIRGKTLIINLPGSKKASEECFRIILPALFHAIAVIQDEKAEVMAAHEKLQATKNPHSCSHDYTTSNNTQMVRACDNKIAFRLRKSPFPAIPVSAAQNMILEEAGVLEVEILNYKDVLGRILAVDIHAMDPLPPFPASIKDGYAVIAADGQGQRQVLGDCCAGEMIVSPKVVPGSCMRINTGAPLPAGADAIIQVEDTELVKASDDGMTELEIKVLKVPTVGQEIRPVGSDIRTGEKVLEASNHIGPFELGILATVGKTQVPVYRKPTVAVVSSGNELMNPEEELIPGYIRDSNKTTLMALLKEYDFPAIDGGIALDNLDSTYEKIKVGLELADVLITTGGVSMGDKDFIKQILKAKFNAKIGFGRVFMKPGLPTTFATVEVNSVKKLVFGLPGNPVSASVTFHLFVLPALKKMSGYLKPHLTVLKAKLAFDVANLDPRPEYQRVCLNWNPGEAIPIARTTGVQMSSRLGNLVNANALIFLPPRAETKTQMNRNDVVDALLLKHV